MQDIAAIIPAYKPEPGFVDIVRGLIDAGFKNVIVVDDGSGSKYASLFTEAEALGADVITHAINMGKGRALKTAFNRYLTQYPDTLGAVTIDADGQHKLIDIERVADALRQNPDKLILGSRRFTGSVPRRSRFGNAMTRWIYALVSGKKLFDTQTGLRAIPRAAVSKMLRLPGERYEFEMSALMELKNMNLDVIEVTIETVYEDGNESSHFNVLKDSWLIYKVILGYVGSSVISFIVDYLLFTFIMVGFERNGSPLDYAATLLVAEVGARVISSFVNFMLNRKVMLSPVNRKQKNWVYLVKYYALAVLVLAADYGIVFMLSMAGVNDQLGKLIAAVILYIVNFLVQKHLVFK